jgi:hypothetical protein
MDHMPRGRAPRLDEQLRALALRFAEEVAALAQRRVDEAVQSEVQTIVRRALKPTGVRLGGRPGDGRLGKPPVPVRCPVPGCAGEGIRAKRNFCAAHAAALPEAEQRRLREAQQAAHAARAPRRRA